MVIYKFPLSFWTSLTHSPFFLIADHDFPCLHDYTHSHAAREETRKESVPRILYSSTPRKMVVYLTKRHASGPPISSRKVIAPSPLLHCQCSRRLLPRTLDPVPPQDTSDRRREIPPPGPYSNNYDKDRTTVQGFVRRNTFFF